MGKLVNEFSVSTTTVQNLNECARKFYFLRYGSWEGWATGSGGPEAKRNYKLKKLESVESLRGSIFHEEAAELTRNTLTPASYKFADLGERVRKKIGETSFFHDKYPNNPWSRKTKKKRTLESMPDDVTKLIHALLVSDILKKLRKFKGRVHTEELEAVDMGNGVKTWVAMDWVGIKNGEAFIVDWKTGKDRSINIRQLAVYAIAAEKLYGAEACRVAYAYVTPKGVEVETPRVVTPAEREEARAFLYDAAEKVDKMIIGGDRKRNAPRANLDKHFPKCGAGPHNAPCLFCNFQEVCYEGV